MPETSFNNRLAQRPRGKEASFEVDIESEVTYYAVDKMLSEKIQAIAQKRGVTADTLINLWVQEKLQDQRVS